MSSDKRHRRGDWRLDDTDSGWTLSVRPGVSIGEVVPFVMSKGPVIVLTGLFSLWVLGDSLDLFTLWSVVPWWALPLAVGLTVISLAFWWWIAPPPVLNEYTQANRVVTVRFHGSKVDTSAGMFDRDHLDTARITPEGALPGRFRIVFTASSSPDADLIGWPGLPRPQAEQILAAVRGRLGEGLTSAST